MAHGAAVRIIYDQSFTGGKVMALITNIGTSDLAKSTTANPRVPGTGTIDASVLNNAATDPRLSIEKISWNISGATSGKIFNVVFEGAAVNASDDEISFSLGGNGHWGKSHTAALDAAVTNNASSPSGDVSIITVGHAAASDTTSIVVILKKESGYGTRSDYSG
jgi:hypothetical protein